MKAQLVAREEDLDDKIEVKEALTIDQFETNGVDSA